MRKENLLPEQCEVQFVNKENVNNMELLNEETVINLAEFFKVFGDSTRIKIIHVLSQKEMCVCDIAELLNLTQSATSHQLRFLRQNKLVHSRKVGKMVYYSLDDEHITEIFNQGLEHIGEN